MAFISQQFGMGTGLVQACGRGSTQRIAIVTRIWHDLFRIPASSTVWVREDRALNNWLDLVISWLPFLFLIGVWILLSRKVGLQARGPSGATMIQLYEQQVEESRRMNANLERIAAALEKRDSTHG